MTYPPDDHFSDETHIYDIAADIVTAARFAPVLRALFQHESGHWCALSDLLAGITLSDEHQQVIRELPDIHITWLLYPTVPAPYAMILFHSDKAFETTFALFNRDFLP